MAQGAKSVPLINPLGLFCFSGPSARRHVQDPVATQPRLAFTGDGRCAAAATHSSEATLLLFANACHRTTFINSILAIFGGKRPQSWKSYP